MEFTITYVSNTEEFMAEVLLKYPNMVKYDESNVASGVNILHAPLKRNELATLAFSALKQEHINMIDNLTTIEILGSFEEIFADSAKDIKYKSVFDYTIPIKSIGEDGVIIESLLSKYITRMA